MQNPIQRKTGQLFGELIMICPSSLVSLYFTLRYGQSDVVLNHILRSAGVVASIFHLSVSNSELDHSGVWWGHPQCILVLLSDSGGDSNPGLVVDHGVVVVPEHVLGTYHCVPQLTCDGHTVAKIHMFLTWPKDGGRGFVDPQPRRQGFNSRRRGCLQQYFIITKVLWVIPNPNLMYASKHGLK